MAFRAAVTDAGWGPSAHLFAVRTAGPIGRLRRVALCAYLVRVVDRHGRATQQAQFSLIGGVVTGGTGQDGLRGVSKTDVPVRQGFMGGSLANEFCQWRGVAAGAWALLELTRALEHQKVRDVRWQRGGRHRYSAPIGHEGCGRESPILPGILRAFNDAGHAGTVASVTPVATRRHGQQPDESRGVPGSCHGRLPPAGTVLDPLRTNGVTGREPSTWHCRQLPRSGWVTRISRTAPGPAWHARQFSRS